MGCIYEKKSAVSPNIYLSSSYLFIMCKIVFFINMFRLHCIDALLLKLEPTNYCEKKIVPEKNIILRIYKLVL